MATARAEIAVKASAGLGSKWKSLRDYLIAFVAIAVTFAIYLFAVVPWIEPAPHRSAGSDARGGREQVPLLPPRIAELFPASSWERQSPRVLSTSHGLLLFQENESRPDGRLLIRPCTLIVDIDGNGKEARPIIVRAPEGAVLQFDRPFSLSQATMGKFLGGQLRGRVTIDRAESRPSADDGLHVETENVQLSPTRIWTSQPVRFQFGRHYGSGRELILSLSVPTNQSGPAFGKARVVELVQVDQIVLEIPPQVSGLPRSSATPEPSTLRLTCDGSFLIDLVAQTATLSRTVRGVHVTPEGLIDNMTAQKLSLGFVKDGTDRRDATRRSALALRNIELRGNPARIDAPSQQLRAEAATIDLNYWDGFLTLEDPNQARMEFQEHLLVTPKVHYEFVPNEPQRLGRFRASGGGEYQQRQASLHIVAQWKGTASLEPAGDEHLFSLPDGATVRIGDSEHFAAQEAYVWLREIPPSPDVVKSTSPDNAPQPARGASDSRQQPTIQLSRLQAKRDVAFSLQGLSGMTQLLECWFEDERDSVPTDSPRNGGSGMVERERLVAVEHPDTGIERKYSVEAGTIRLQWVRRGKSWQVQQGQLLQNVQLTESPDGVFSGETVELLRSPDGLARLDLLGSPAMVRKGGITVKGNAIHLDQSLGRLWMEDAGAMTAPVRLATNASASMPVTMHWQGGMDFDGAIAKFQRDVSITGAWPHERKGQVSRFALTGGSMLATIEPAIDFRHPPKRENVELATVQFPGAVSIRHNLVRDDGALLSRDALHVQDLELDYRTGEFHSRHPGWGESTRFGSDLNPTNGASRVPSATSSKLTYVRIDFQKAMAGNYRQRRVRFWDNVRAIIGPVASWDERLDPDHPERLGPRSFLLHCQDLVVLQNQQAGTSAVELQANRSVRVDGIQFSATGERMVYDQSKEVFLLQGDGRVPARLRYRAGQNSPPSQVTLGSLRYSLRTGQLLSNDIQGANVSDPRR